MGHTAGFPCIHDNPNHEGGCSTPVPHDFVDLGQTLWLEVDGHYWRTNRTAPRGYQVEFQRDNGSWTTSRSMPTEARFFEEMAGRWRELEPDEAQRVAGGAA